MEKFFMTIGIASFFGMITGLIIGLSLVLVEKIKLCLEVRRSIKHEIE